jgi:peroxiredoxin (alkyl hydroperoxide reductase subunit C)
MYDEFQALGVEFLAMSTDSRFIHKMWQEHELSKMVKGRGPFPMLSDSGGKIGVIYGVYDEAAGVDIRGRFIIDPDFVIRAMEMLTPEVGRNPKELVRKVKAFQHVRATGEVTPSGLGAGASDPQARTRAGGPGLGGLEALSKDRTAA